MRPNSKLLESSALPKMGLSVIQEQRDGTVSRSYCFGHILTASLAIIQEIKDITRGDVRPLPHRAPRPVLTSHPTVEMPNRRQQLEEAHR